MILLSAGQRDVAKYLRTHGGTLTAGLVKSTGFGRDSRFEMMPVTKASIRLRNWHAASRSAYFGEGSR